MATKTEAPKQDPKASSLQKTSRVDWRKQKELEEARKAGTAPPEVDEEGRDINPHIPQYITSVPWYIGLDRPTLKHQRPQDEKQKKYSGLDDWYKRGAPKVPAATKFRKGACVNCGAMTHKKKECLERPRKVGAKYTGDDIRPDEFIQPELSFDYAGKRDRWAGYNIDNHSKIVEEYSKIDEAKRHIKAAKLDEELAEGLTEAVTAKMVNDDDEEDDDKYADGLDMPGQKFDSNVRTTVRNLRIREDTAKYLYNLDPNSSYYDPKTRSMRESPFRESIKGKTVNYYGDNWVRSSGDVRQMAGAQMFAWEAYERGADVHLQADPTKLELLHREYAVKKDTFEKGQKESILEKYGGEEHLDAPPKDLLLAQTEEYVEYSRTGKIIKGQEKAIAKSKYEEDVYINNHTSVFGSYWEDFKWGYSCCHSFVKMSYCTGEAGKRAKMSETPLQEAIAGTPPVEDRQKSLLELHKEKMEGDKMKNKGLNDKSDENDDDEAERLDRLKKALKAEEKRTKEIDQLLKVDERKRPYNSLHTEYREPTEDEMDAYKMKRRRDDDPMAQFSK